MNIRDIFYSIFRKEDYLTYYRGDMNLIITACHGGDMRPLSIPNRKTGKKQKDGYTKSVTELILKRFKRQKPYYIIADIHRSKVDLNREIEEGAQGNPQAQKIWSNWNWRLDSYKEDILRNYGKGLLIDIHSNNDSNQFQLGYAISANDYIAVYKGENNTKSSLNSLNGRLREKMFGQDSIKDTLEMYGYDVLMPSKDDTYFNGGRNIEYFSGNGLGAIQIEIPTNILKQEKELVAETISDAIKRFLAVHVK